MKILKEETQLVGSWVKNEKNQLKEDEITQRIQWLIKNYLEKVGVSDDGWSTLYRDPEDNRYWEMTYPQSEMHGGGPPALLNISKEEAQKKYKV